MFYTTENNQPQSQAPRITLGERLRDLGRLALDFLTLEDGYEPDWASAPDGAATRPLACEGRGHVGHPASVSAPWISA